MYTIVATICFIGMSLSPTNPLCWQQCRVPMTFETESSCILVRDQLVKDLNTDLYERNITMALYCSKLKITSEASHEQTQS
mgnify:CR=1 FL=1|tara:strand:+ start:605 stop:847 length:243 start_codon:yes stop_codon:yes gene_type:complete